jgi:hypothetical protein
MAPFSDDPEKDARSTMALLKSAPSKLESRRKPFEKYASLKFAVGKKVRKRHESLHREDRLVGQFGTDGDAAFGRRMWLISSSEASPIGQQPIQPWKTSIVLKFSFNLPLLRFVLVMTECNASNDVRDTVRRVFFHFGYVLTPDKSKPAASTPPSSHCRKSYSLSRAALAWPMDDELRRQRFGSEKSMGGNLNSFV